MSSLIERLQNGEKVKCQVRDDGLEKWEEAEVWSYDGYLLHSYRGDPRANSAFWRYARVLDEIDEEPTDTMPEELPVAPSEQKTDEKQYNINTARIADGEITGETQEERFKRLTEVKADAKQVGGDHYKTFKIQPYQFCYENKLNNLQSEVVSLSLIHI